MTRDKQFDEQRALHAVMRLFWEKGYSATSMQDLEVVTGLARTSLYNAFGNKNSLFKKALGLYMAMMLEKLREIAEQAPTAKATIRDFLEMVINLHFSKESPGGCLVVLSVMESSQHDDETIAMTKEMFQTKRRLLAEILEKGKQRGEFGEDFDVEGTATAMVAMAAGTVVQAKAGVPATVLADTVRAAMRLLER